ncbi:Zinc/iron permease [Stachybotrys elegans]|uniref:Zinc/iron permease n=1 Tax=Stachybotrys elegans TaxID=80388 RepID=A0A8K0WQ49_9HYPO|nr:Zinc/iron permease [Stachybotrys elegans]
MGSVLLLLALCAVMAVVSFLAGALPLSMSLSASQLRLLSSIGVGILVGTSLIVIIPEGISASVAPAEAGHIHRVRTLARRNPWASAASVRAIVESTPAVHVARDEAAAADALLSHIAAATNAGTDDDDDNDVLRKRAAGEEAHEHEDHHNEIPTFEIGVSLILGFVLMFLIDRLPRHATESLQAGPQTRHMSMDNLTADSASIDEEADGFLGSMAPTPKRARSLATTLGLVIHAAADGIAMGASSTTEDMKLGFIIFFAIMIHKAPAAFGLTSVLLKQGLSKRAARGHLIVFSLAAPVGALATWFLIVLLGGDNADGETGQWWTGMLLLFSGGTFLYVAMHAMQDDASAHGHEHSSSSNGYAEGGASAQRKVRGPQMRDTMATMVGMMLPLLTQFGHHH